VRDALALLPPAQREVVTLRDIDGWTGDEVCHALELSEGNQRVLLHRGRSKVRAALEAYLATCASCAGKHCGSADPSVAALWAGRRRVPSPAAGGPDRDRPPG